MNSHSNDEDNEVLEIISNYEKGAKMKYEENLEDPANYLYEKTNKYGFIQDAIMDTSLSKVNLLENNRNKKWLKICMNWDHDFPSIKTINRIYKGVPDALRGLVWTKLLCINQLMNDNEGVYARMKNAGLQYSKDIKQIDLDVNRTYRNHIMFHRRYDIKQQALFYNLVAYSVYNKEVSYCQGMSQISAILLMYLNEEDAFWALVALMTEKKHYLHGFFIPGFPKLIRFQDHYNRILKKLLPAVRKNLDKNEMYPCLYTVKWFLQCFLDRVPFSLSLRLWDIYLLEGESLLISMSYNIVRMHKYKLAHMNQDELMHFFQIQLAENFQFTDDQVIQQLKISNIHLRQLRLIKPPPAESNTEIVTKQLGYLDIENESNYDKERYAIPADGGFETIPISQKCRFSLCVESHLLDSTDNLNNSFFEQGCSQMSPSVDMYIGSLDDNLMINNNSLELNSLDSSENDFVICKLNVDETEPSIYKTLNRNNIRVIGDILKIPEPNNSNVTKEKVNNITDITSKNNTIYIISSNVNKLELDSSKKNNETIKNDTNITSTLCKNLETTFLNIPLVPEKIYPNSPGFKISSSITYNNEENKNKHTNGKDLTISNLFVNDLKNIFTKDISENISSDKMSIGSGDNSNRYISSYCSTWSPCFTADYMDKKSNYEIINNEEWSTEGAVQIPIKHISTKPTNVYKFLRHHKLISDRLKHNIHAASCSKYNDDPLTPVTVLHLRAVSSLNLYQPKLHLF